jgi:hypothetical protein
VFRIERRFVRFGAGEVMQKTSYGVTTLTREEANPDRLLQVGRAHWGIENGLHYRRDETLREDRYRLKGQGAHAMAVISKSCWGHCDKLASKPCRTRSATTRPICPLRSSWFCVRRLDFASAPPLCRILVDYRPQICYNIPTLENRSKTSLVVPRLNPT